MTSRVSPAAAVGCVVASVGASSGTRWVGIDGKGAAGKSSLADRMQSALPGAVVIRVDDFARPDVTSWERDRFVAAVVTPLVSGEPARYQRWDWATNTGGVWVEVPVGLVVIVEGVSATDQRLPVPWDVTLWVEAPRDVRLRRALERDGQAMMAQWLGEWMPSEDAYEVAQRPQARVDLIVDGTG